LPPGRACGAPFSTALLLPGSLGAALFGSLLAPGGVFPLAGLAVLAAHHAQFVTAAMERLPGGLALATAVLALALGGPPRLVGRHLLGIRAAGIRKDLPRPSGRHVWRGHGLGTRAGGRLTDARRGERLGAGMGQRHDAQVDIHRLLRRQGMHGRHTRGRGRRSRTGGRATRISSATLLWPITACPAWAWRSRAAIVRQPRSCRCVS